MMATLTGITNRAIANKLTGSSLYIIAHHPSKDAFRVVRMNVKRKEVRQWVCAWVPTSLLLAWGYELVE